MKNLYLILISLEIFLLSFGNSLFYIDYQVNKSYYVQLCVNKNKPEILCNGKCVVRKASTNTGSPITQIKNSFEFNIVLSYPLEIDTILSIDLKKRTIVVSFNQNFTLEGYLKNGFHPPEFLV